MQPPLLGQICEFGFNFAPKDWAFCIGTLLPISDNQALFSLLGTAYGGDGRTTFGLPDLRGTLPISQGQHPGSSYDWEMGQRGGAESHTLTEAQIPVHTHVASFVPGSQDTNAQLHASVDAATTDTPAAGSYIASNDGGREDGVFMYRPDAGSGTVSLGGVSGGNGAGGEVDVHTAGGSQSFSILQPVLTVNFCISTEGLYPSRD